MNSLIGYIAVGFILYILANILVFSVMKAASDADDWMEKHTK